MTSVASGVLQRRLPSADRVDRGAVQKRLMAIRGEVKSSHVEVHCGQPSARVGSRAGSLGAPPGLVVGDQPEAAAVDRLPAGGQSEVCGPAVEGLSYRTATRNVSFLKERIDNKIMAAKMHKSVLTCLVLLSKEYRCTDQ